MRHYFRFWSRRWLSNISLATQLTSCFNHNWMFNGFLTIGCTLAIIRQFIMIRQVMSCWCVLTLRLTGIHELLKFNGCRTSLHSLKPSLKSSKAEQAHFAGMHHRTLEGRQLQLIPIGRPRITRMLCQEKTGDQLEGPRHTIRNIADSNLKSAMHSRFLAQRKVLRYMTLWQGLNTGKPMELFLNEKYACVQCAWGNQQVEGESFKSSDLYAPTLKAPEARLLAAIAAEYGCPLLKTDTRQAFL